ncbi:MAG TPA: tRNA (adenosine(37)-N6)-threonylcarbamoyltransferase complex dimerization subunit type 1 TsaB [Gemmataceae bacterium]|nr:tRNA (adenosine(37)-N6)-threonylcarbamoyltransferase complex dimerization subunit type 1 TsaB [Gemmataceae bacterium]
MDEQKAKNASMAPPRLLLLETSHQPGFVALAEGETLLGVRRLDEARRHARDLAPAVGELLSAQGWKPRDVQTVVVGRGPGSYTGLRVGIMSAKAFAYATGCTLLGLETFAVIAAQAPPDAIRLAVLADAQQDKVYVQEFEHNLPVAPLRITSFNDWLHAATKPLWVSGPGLRKWAAHLAANMKPLEPQLWEPQPETMLRLGLARQEKGERDAVWSMEPIYLRPSAAEEQWAKRG